MLIATGALSQFVGMTAEDFTKADSDGELLIEALRSKFKCSVIVRTKHDRR